MIMEETLQQGLVSPATDNHASRALCVHPSNIPPLNNAYSLRNPHGQGTNWMSINCKSNAIKTT